MNTDMVSYYKERANEYEKIYARPERQHDLLLATQILQEAFRDKEVLEIACGTGYWTKIISKTADSILATDINDAVINLAKSKAYFASKIKFQLVDIFNLPGTTKHESLFGGFIWSHIKLQELVRFIDIINYQVKPGNSIVFMDNNFVEGSNLPLTDIDNFGNTYQTRQLENGTMYKVVKNFPTEDFIKQLLTGKAKNIEFIKLEHYWILKYKTIQSDSFLKQP
jgi:demethylmenaquinone methyltransferase/2-methoxy-6-polyprenyl-1,4-benzoquinol methylase